MVPTIIIAITHCTMWVSGGGGCLLYHNYLPPRVVTVNAAHRDIFLMLYFSDF